MTKLRSLVRGFAAVAVTAMAVACSNTKSGSTTSPDTGQYKNYCDLPQSCKDIAQACMPKDDGSPGTVHDCHLAGHEQGDKSVCDAKHDLCVQTCDAKPAFTDGPVEDLSAPCHDSGLGGGTS
jgi:hypothetical protein